MSEPSWKNSNLVSALITGFLGLLGTFITIYATRPQPVIVPEPVTPVIDPQPVSPGPTAPDLARDFVQYQNRVSLIDVSAEEKQSYIVPLIGKQVVWRGYLDSVTKHTKPTQDSYFTISLVESRDLLSQPMFKTPALFRMPHSELELASCLKKGDEIVLTATFESHSMVGTILTGGHLQLGPRQEQAVRMRRSLESLQLK